MNPLSRPIGVMPYLCMYPDPPPYELVLPGLGLFSVIYHRIGHAIVAPARQP